MRPHLHHPYWRHLSHHHGHFEHHRCGPPPRRNRLAWYLMARMHRRLFAAFAAAILLTGFVVVSVMAAVRTGPTWRNEIERGERYLAGRFTRAWADPGARAELAAATARDLDVDVTLEDSARASSQTFTPSGARATPACARPAVEFAVGPGERPYGHVRVCTERHRATNGLGRLGIVLGSALVVLWALAGFVARRLTRPLSELVRVVEDIGKGKLSSRMQLRPHDGGEVGVIAHAVNDMAERIERQIEDQRDLLAAVSHEIRSPLARMRFMVETLRPDPEAPVSSPHGRTLDEMDRELQGVDALVGDLLASSRMDFDALNMVELDPADTAHRALERAGLDASLLTIEGAPSAFHGDATLVQCALTNLLANARKHGDAVRSLHISGGAGRVRFAVEDGGAGFASGEVENAFKPFYRGDQARTEQRAGVGLGLALVARIAELHGGRAHAENLPEGGARVFVEFAVRPPRVMA